MNADLRRRRESVVASIREHASLSKATDPDASCLVRCCAGTVTIGSAGHRRHSWLWACCCSRSARRTHKVAVVLVFALFAAACTSLVADRFDFGQHPTCNGAAEMCLKRLDQVFFLGSHNTMASVAALSFENVTATSPFVAPTQFNPVLDQLQSAGVRALGVDRVYDSNDDRVQLCDSANGCKYGETDLDTVLGGVRSFLDADVADRDNITERPGGQVILLIIHGSVKASALSNAFRRTGLLSSLYAPPVQPATTASARSSGSGNGGTARAPAVWPTLGELLCVEDRINGSDVYGGRSVAPDEVGCTARNLVVFVEEVTEGTLPWALDLWGTFWQTAPQVQHADNLTCHFHSGNSSGPFMLANVFLSDPGPSPALAIRVNYNPNLLAFFYDCYNVSDTGAVGGTGNASATAPNVAMLDFVDIGDGATVATVMNGGFPAPTSVAEQYVQLQWDAFRLLRLGDAWQRWRLPQVGLLVAIMALCVCVFVLCCQCLVGARAPKTLGGRSIHLLSPSLDGGIDEKREPLLGGQRGGI